MTLALQACLQNAPIQDDNGPLITAAGQTEAYLGILDGKKTALVANHTSMLGSVHLADTLLSLGVDLVRVFSPEHGFRGTADAGALVENGVDARTGLPVISLYGSHKKPTHADLQDIDIILFDIQDVGVRFYTYISTMSYVMEAAAEEGIPVVVLDRPNPNGFYIDGPVMEDCCKSFVGLHPVPIVYAMTIGEYAMMVNGEGWLANGISCKLTVIPLKNFDRNKLYELPIKPSPNLPGWQSVYLYPSLCLFEGTIVSVGRGTEFPFTVYGHPDIKTGSFAFTPHPMPGAKHPKLEGELCYGQNLKGYAENFLMNDEHLNLVWLLNAYHETGAGAAFFTSYFEKLAGTISLREQIMNGLSQEEIKASWQDGLKKFKSIRDKYLLYPDFTIDK